MIPVRQKLVAIGNDGVGKTSLLIRFVIEKFPEVYIPRVFESIYNVKLKVDGKEVELMYLDTLGGEDPVLLRVRSLSYPQTNVFLLCYSVEMRDSFEDIPDRWISEVRHYCPNVPVILCANKIDLRHDKEVRMDLERRGTSFVTPEEGLEMARRIKAFAFFECSARVGSNVNNVFQEAVLAGYLVENKRRKKCHIL